MIDPATRTAVDVALAAQDMERATTLAESALAAGQRDPLLFDLVAWSREEAGDFAAAHALLKQALALAPDDPFTLTAVGRALRKEGRLSEALAAFDAAIARDPGCQAAWLERAFALDAGNSLRLAADSYRQAAALDPNSSDALAGLATVSAQLGHAADVREFGGRALALNPDDERATMALARLDTEERAFERAAERLQGLVKRGNLRAEIRIGALTLLGDALDRLDETTRAFAAYSEAQSLFAELHAARFGQGPTHRDFVERIDAEFARIDPRKWAPLPLLPVPGEAATHVFLIGYPRSGTTLVENILASAPGVEALEERPTLAEAERAFLVEESGIVRLADLDARAATHFREAYWRKVASCGLDVASKMFVDMDPLKGIGLPIIARLFPEARIIVMRRDPRDVVWSCFRRNFVSTSANYEFTSIDRTARHYDAAMRLMDRSFRVLPINVHFVRYDDLVTDFDSITAAMCAFLGLPWTPALREFSRTADRRGVTTTSVTQVRKGLFNGAGQWRRYYEQLEPVLPILRPWVEKFGFPA